MTRAIGYVRVADVADPDGRAREGDHRGAINHAAARYGWDLVDVVIDRDGIRDRDVLGAMNAGLAEVLLCADSDLWPGPEDLISLVEIAAEHGWRLVCLASGFEQGTEPASEALMWARRLREYLPVGATAPMPPAAMRGRVTGRPANRYFDATGRMHLDEIGALIDAAGSPLSTRRAILDFGCGCGRLTRHLPVLAPEATVCAADIDREAIVWVREHLRVDVVESHEWPPLQLRSEQFDLVVAFSVFTHLDERHQDAWLEELHRLLCPDGLLVASVHGRAALNWHQQHPLVRIPPEAEAEFERDGITFWAGDDWADHFPGWYHTTHHSRSYVLSHWARWFEVIKMQPSRKQELVVLRRRPLLSGTI